MIRFVTFFYPLSWRVTHHHPAKGHQQEANFVLRWGVSSRGEAIEEVNISPSILGVGSDVRGYFVNVKDVRFSMV